jgi:hypothetical protein
MEREVRQGINMKRNDDNGRQWDDYDGRMMIMTDGTGRDV